MALSLLKEKWTNKINTLKIGAAKEEGGTRTSTITVGGEGTLPFLFDEGDMPNPPVIAMEVLDVAPKDWPPALSDNFKDVLSDPVKWSEKCVSKYGARIIALKLQSTHPEWGDASPEKAAKTVKSVLSAVGVPLILLGSGDQEKDNVVLAKCSEAAKGERCLIGNAVEKNYKTLTVSCLADGHNIIAESPIDINIAKQVNILIHDMGLPLDRIAIYPTTGSLGYGMEYAYSIMERARLAALSGDKTVASPFICFVGQEAWRAKEAKVSSGQGMIWEAITATALLQAGADILVMRHPKAIEKVNKYIEELVGTVLNSK